MAKGDTSKRGERNPEAAPEPEDEDAMDWEPTESEVLSSLHEMRRGAMLLHVRRAMDVVMFRGIRNDEDDEGNFSLFF